jgi:hypothetical protein
LANFLNSTALPSITGLAASGPMAPRPSTAVPLVMTPTRLARAVKRARFARKSDDLFAGRRHARRIGHREVILVGQLLGRLDRHLSRLGIAVVEQGGNTQLIFFFVHIHAPREGRVTADAHALLMASMTMIFDDAGKASRQPQQIGRP